MDNPYLLVAVVAAITAVFTGLGALPFVFFHTISNRSLGYANAFASGLMTGASVGLVVEGVAYSTPRLLAGMATGLLAIYLAKTLLPNAETTHIGKLKGAPATKAILIVGVMTIHSFAEGVGVGVSFGGGETLGILISSAIALHNIPEGLAISLVLIPRGVSVSKAALWSIFSSLPQPLLAVPSYAFVEVFEPFLPFGFGLAAGAMLWMVFAELMPDAVNNAPKENVGFIATAGLIAMLAFQLLLR